jgi:pyruvate dehydrogenase E1 component alpha subunit
MGTALAREHANTDLALRAASYSMVAWAVDGMDADAVAAAVRRACDLIRTGGGPCFLEMRTYRFRAHSMYDPDLYRDKPEIEEWKKRDPIPALSDRLRSSGALDDSTVRNWEKEIAAEIADAVAIAEAAAPESVTDLTRYVYSEHSDRS